MSVLTPFLKIGHIGTINFPPPQENSEIIWGQKWYGQKRNEYVRKHTHIKISLVRDKFLGRGACVHIVKLQNESCEDT